jgi:biopolymer transport protein TolQ
VRIFGYPAFAILQAPGASDSGSGFGTGLFGLIAESSLLSQGVLLSLLILSILSWAISVFKLWQFRQIEGQTETFIDVFRKSGRFSEVQAACKSLAASPLTGVFQAGYVELNAQLRRSRDDDGSGGYRDPAARPALRSLDALDRALLRAASVEMIRLERHVPVLATTASIAPFIGLFGTVWGIIIAFQGIGETGSTSLAVVAPGIADALVATAAGLFAAIPAVYFYNHLTQKTKVVASAIDDFALEFLNIAERNFSP